MIRIPGPAASSSVGALCLLLLPVHSLAQAEESATARPLEEIVVTAQRREERLSDVPISVAAYSKARLDAQGVRSIDDIARLTPGITFSRSDNRNGMASDIAIRGISSTVAASTTGIYIDDTPIQTRVIGAGASGFNTFPAVFDVERVEILRGPQGTLFGAGSEGGTLRFITPKPNLYTYDVYGRGETSVMDNGDPSYEGGLAVGGPIVEGILGFRVSAWQRHRGGYIDRANTDPQPGDPPLAVLDLNPGSPPTVIPARDRISYTAEENTNSLESQVARGALTFAPNDQFEVTGSVYYQKQRANDASTYWEHLSDPDSGDYAHGLSIPQWSEDEFWLPSLSISWDLGPVRLFSNTSYFDRNQEAQNDYTAFESSLWADYWEFPVGMFAPTTQINDQQSWTQEVRIESTDSESRLQWVAGVFYQKTDQESIQRVQNTFLPDLFFDAFGVPLEVVFGQGLDQGLYTFNQDPVTSTDEQLAGFLQVDLDLTDALTLTAGVRVADTKFDATAVYNGPVVGAEVNDAGSNDETPVTPKFGISYQATSDNLVYATAAKGFRVGGYNPQIGLPCVPQLATLGYGPSPGNPTGRPTTYESDTLWSYEIGTKNSFLEGRARLNASAYYIDWDNIQQGVELTSCGFRFTINAGRAVSRGFDLEASYLLGDSVTVGTAIGYNDATYKETVLGGPGAAVPIISDGDRIPGSPWTFTANAQYDFLAFEREAYFRFDYEYRSEGPDDTATLNPTNRSPVLPPLDPRIAIPEPETHSLSIRTGLLIGNADISVFVQNALNENPNLGRTDLAFSPAPFGPDTHNYTGRTLLPRTVGLTVTYRN